MNPITHVFPEHLTQALGWTLLHSLWQGALIALLLGLVLVVLQRHSAKTRYRVAGAALLAQLLLAAGTFAAYSSPTGASYLKTPAAIQPLTAAAHTQGVLQADGPAFWMAPLSAAQVYFEQYLPLLVTLWLLGMLLMALRFAGGLAYTQRLRHYKAMPMGAHWQQKVDALAQRMGMATAVRLLESALVQVPVAIGVLKPVILLPIGAVSGLRPEQLEAVLAHELAHILRKDYLVNLLQTAVDTLFFYHPAMWWVSGVVRAERENCCDDMAVAVCGNTLTYARALAQLEEMRLPAPPAMALAISGRQGSLVSRVKRLLGQPPLKPTFREGLAVAFTLVVGLLMLSFGAMAGLQPATLPESTSPEKRVTINKVLLKNDGAMAYTVQDSTGKTRDIVIVKNKKGKVKELYVDGKRIPKKHMKAYETLVNQRLQAVENAPRATRQEVEVEMKAARAAAADAAKGNREAYSYQMVYVEGDSTLPPPPPLPPLPPAPGMMPPLPPAPPAPPAPNHKRAQQEIERYEVEIKTYEKGMEKQQKEVRKHIELNERQHQQDMAAHEKEMERHHKAQFERVKAEMVKDGILKESDKNLNIRFKNDELYVNDKKQSKEMAEKYRNMLHTGEKR